MVTISKTGNEAQRTKTTYYEPCTAIPFTYIHLFNLHNYLILQIGKLRHKAV